jgi:hypothetical protein
MPKRKAEKTISIHRLHIRNTLDIKKLIILCSISLKVLAEVINIRHGFKRAQHQKRAFFRDID